MTNRFCCSVCLTMRCSNSAIIALRCSLTSSSLSSSSFRRRRFFRFSSSTFFSKASCYRFRMTGIPFCLQYLLLNGRKFSLYSVNHIMFPLINAVFLYLEERKITGIQFFQLCRTVLKHILLQSQTGLLFHLFTWKFLSTIEEKFLTILLRNNPPIISNGIKKHILFFCQS